MQPDYSLLEREIAKYERRIKRIEENPDPTKLKSTKLLYQLELSEKKDWLEAWRAGKPFAYTMGAEELFDAMGIRCIPLSLLADKEAAYSQPFFNTARSVGYPSDICDRLQVSMGIAETGVIPRPSFVAGASASCNVEMQTMVALAYKFDAPTYIVDRYVEPDEEPLDYIVAQFWEMIRLVEKTVPGAGKFDEDKLGEIQEKERQAQIYLNDLFNAAKREPCPLRGQDMFRIVEPRMAARPGGLEYFRVLHDEIMERVAKGVTAVDEEKARAMWLVAGPYFDDAMSILEQRGVSVPIFQWDMLPRFYGYGKGRIGDTSEYGRRLRPVEEFARCFRVNVWSGPAEKWIAEVIANCREFKIDMLVYYMLSGCPTNLLSGKLVAERVEKELGLPVLLLEGHMIDKEKYDRSSLENKLNVFVDVVLGTKGVGRG